jgi:hypothetical protein
MEDGFMASKKPAGLFGGLILEIGLLLLIVSLLPKLPLGQAAGGAPAGQAEEIADHRPSLAPPPAPLARESVNWRAAIATTPPQDGLTQIGEPRAAYSGDAWESERQRPRPQPAVDPAYVEQRLDQAGQKLLGQMNSILTRQAERLLDVPTPGSFPTDAPPRAPNQADARPSMYRAPVVPAYPR